MASNNGNNGTCGKKSDSRCASGGIGLFDEKSHEVLSYSYGGSGTTINQEGTTSGKFIFDLSTVQSLPY